jgi:ABC-type dipeptide/oligopeptide/nickel transport system permease component
MMMTSTKGDPAVLALQQAGQAITPDALAKYHHQLGLDQPLPVRYVEWLLGLLHGDFGQSFNNAAPVSGILLTSLGPTLVLGFAALALSSLVGVSLGTIFALRHGTLVDNAGRTVTLVLASVPSFCVGIILIVVLGEKLRWVPVAGYGIDLHLAMPTVALALAPAASLMRLTRSCVLDARLADHVCTARSKGLPERSVTVSHILRNSAIPITTMIGIRVGHIVAGAVIIETMFAWPGMGMQMLTAISGRDLPVIGGFLLVAGTLFVLVNLVMDVACALLDPRIRLGGSGVGS